MTSLAKPVYNKHGVVIGTARVAPSKPAAPVNRPALAAISANALPQTGETNDDAAIWIGLVLLSMTASAAWLYRRRRSL